MSPQIDSIALGQMHRRAGRATLTRALLSGLIRGIDLLVIALSGFGSYLIYPASRDEALLTSHVGAVLVAIALYASVSHWLGAYREKKLLSQTLLVNRALTAWAITFALLLLIAFAYKSTSHFSRIWGVWRYRS